jgi:hypothetical protein
MEGFLSQEREARAAAEQRVGRLERALRDLAVEGMAEGGTGYLDIEALRCSLKEARAQVQAASQPEDGGEGFHQDTGKEVDLAVGTLERRGKGEWILPLRRLATRLGAVREASPNSNPHPSPHPNLGQETRIAHGRYTQERRRADGLWDVLVAKGSREEKVPS